MHITAGTPEPSLVLLIRPKLYRAIWWFHFCSTELQEVQALGLWYNAKKDHIMAVCQALPLKKRWWNGVGCGPPLFPGSSSDTTAYEVRYKFGVFYIILYYH